MSRNSLDGNEICSIILKYGSDILKSEVFRKSVTQTHHVYGTVFDHTINVCIVRIRLCRQLKSRGIRVNEKDLEVRKTVKEAEDAKAETEKLIRDRERLIREEVEDREERIWDIYILKKQRALADAEEKWKAGNKNLIRWGASVSLYAMVLTILLGYMSEAYRTALKAAGRQTGGWYCLGWLHKAP